jgi:hypothetical protein
VNDHPDVVLAIKHREQRERYEAMREREPELDLKPIVKELAAIVAGICLDDYHQRDGDARECARQLLEDAKKLEDRLS